MNDEISIERARKIEHIARLNNSNHVQSCGICRAVLRHEDMRQLCEEYERLYTIVTKWVDIGHPDEVQSA